MRILSFLTVIGILDKSVQVVKEGGTVVSLPSPEFSEEVTQLVAKKNVDLSFMLVQSSKEDIDQISQMLETGKLKPHVSKTFAFDQMGDAHHQLESGRTVGKVIIKM